MKASIHFIRGLIQRKLKCVATVTAITLFVCFPSLPALAEIKLSEYIAQRKLSNQHASELYVQGLFDGLNWANAELRNKKRPQLFCAPGLLAIDVDSILKLFDGYLEGLSEQRKEDLFKSGIYVGPVFLLALQDQFPCGKQ